MKRLPMMLQLAFILFCVMAIPTATLTWYSGAQILRNSDHAIAESAMDGLNASRNLNENRLDNLSQMTIRLASTHIFDRIRAYANYESFNSNYENVLHALSVQEDLLSLNQNGEGVYSSFFYLSGSDYVVSTDKGIIRLDQYESIDWMKEALEGHKGISGIWYPRRLDTGMNVISYVLPLNRLSTTTRGTIVVNLRESQIGLDMQSSPAGGQSYMLLNQDGTILSHQNKDLLYTDGTKDSAIRQLLGKEATDGYMFHESRGERYLYTWSSSSRYGWTYVNIHSVDDLLTKAHTLHRNIIFLTVLIIFAGTILTVFLATWLSKPARELVRALRKRGHSDVKGRNELAYLDATFRRMQEEEETLRKLSFEREEDARSLAVHNLLRGERVPQAEKMFPDRYFLVALISVDQYRKYVGTNNPEVRSHHCQLLVSQCDRSFPGEMHTRCVYRGEGCFAVVINYGNEAFEFHDILVEIQDQAAGILGHSVTIGVSSQADSIDAVPECVAEAMEGTKQRMIAGSGGIAYWNSQEQYDKKYIYPEPSERRILHLLDKGDLAGITHELDFIGSQIRSAEYISYDNILFIYHQLAGATIKHLQEKSVSATRIFAGSGNIYAALASIDTLEELEAYLYGFYADIVKDMDRAAGETNKYGRPILTYLKEHYHEEIVFEDMAKEIGISYSYMRKIIFDLTGVSLADYLNQLRIEKAKELLSDPGLTIAQFACKVGYCNVQSFNRNFRKFVGMTPGSYKTVKLPGAPAG